jgi:hypothetical protein
MAKPELFWCLYRNLNGTSLIAHAWATSKCALPQTFNIDYGDITWHRFYPFSTPQPPTHWAKKRAWAKALHATIYMRHWAMMFSSLPPDPLPWEDGRIVHELAHLATGLTPLVTEKRLMKMLRTEERALRGFTSERPLCGSCRD